MAVPSDELPPGVEPEIAPAIEEKPVENAADNEDAEEGEASDDDKDSEEDSDDDVNVVIGDIKTSSTYTALNLKRGGLVTASTGVDKMKQAGKFSIDEFESIGSINGVSAQEYNVDSLEDKPWRKPGADITDYFNYGFNEDTWRAYCERQKRMRVHESGVGLVTPMNSIGMPRGATSITNDNSKYSGNFIGPRKAGPPPGRKMTGSIDVIGGNSGLASRRGLEAPLTKGTPPKENVIQVMTADRREYSRKPPGFPDMSVPPPGTGGFDSDMSMPPPGFDNYNPPDFFNPEPEPYYGGGYEPTQDSQWDPSNPSPNWAPSEIKELTPGPVLPPPMVPPNMVPPPTPYPQDTAAAAAASKDEYVREESRESRSRSEKPDRHRERSHRRERSRSRSRRHKSRSRSPSHRSHRKKKSRRHDKEESD